MGGCSLLIEKTYINKQGHDLVMRGTKTRSFQFIVGKFKMWNICCVNIVAIHKNFGKQKE